MGAMGAMGAMEAWEAGGHAMSAGLWALALT